MGSVVRRMRKRRRCLGEGRVLRRGEYQGLELNTKVELIRSLIPLGLRTLTLHRLGVDDLLGISFKTTNCIESANALVEERCSKVDAWKTSHQRHRWLATRCSTSSRGCDASEAIDTSQLQAALRRARNIKQQPDRMEKAA
jgi:hypothetical protein